MSGYVITITDGNVQLKEVPSAPSLKDLQEAVGGYIEPLFTLPSCEAGREVTGYVNEEGLLIGLKPNVRVFERDYPCVGPLVIAALDDEGDTQPLTQREAEMFKLITHRDLRFPVLMIG